MPAAIPVTVVQAARELRVTPAAVRRMLRLGAPNVSPGAPGRGKGALVLVSDLKAWRARRRGMDGDVAGADRFIDQLAACLLEVLRCDAGGGLPLYRVIGITEGQTAAVLATVFERVYRRIHGRYAERVPPEIETIVTVCVLSRRTRSRGG